MSGFGAFLKKELMETLRTWRIWVLPGILMFFGATSPLFAQLTPAILKSVGSSNPGVVIQIPPPTYLDAYAQWTKNLSQIGLFAVIISMSGMVSAERKSGTAQLVLTKPVSRSAFVVAKALSGLGLLTFATVAGGALCWAGTLALFGKAPLGAFAAGTALWLVFAGFFVCAMTLLSAAIDGQPGAAGAGIGLYALVSVSSIWPPAGKFTLAGVMPAAGQVLAGKAAEPLWPVVFALVLGALCVAAGARVFSRREL